ncbi:DUF3861 family protein [Humidesulfovibrio idahonensis]
MNTYAYQITVEQACVPGMQNGTPDDSPMGEWNENGGTTLCFQAAGHEDWFRLLGRAQQLGLAEGGAPALVLGLKLLGGVVLANRDNVLFEELRPQLGVFMQRLKRG